MARGKGVDRHGRSKVKAFIKIPHEVFDAFIANERLGPNAMAVLLALIRRHNGANNGSIGYPARAGKDLGLGWTATASALRALAETGFITVERRGAFTVKSRKAAEYALAWLPVGNRAPSLGWRVPEPKIKNGPPPEADGPPPDAAGPRFRRDSPPPDADLAETAVRRSA